MKMLLVALAFVSTQAFAWGPTGHRTVGEIAEGKLKSSTLKKVRKILKGKSLAQVSTWADEIRSEPETYKHTFRWHYTDYPKGMDKLDETKSSGQLITSIQEQLKVLKDKKSSDDQKEFALKFLVHLVGDLHMPLHVGNGIDRGGNWCHVTFHDQKMNLHHLWDEGMIDFTKLSFTELTRLVQEGVSDQELKAFTQGSVSDWASETKEIRDTVYPAEANPDKKKKSVHFNYCHSDESKVRTSMRPKLGYEYSYKFMPVLEKQLLKGGVRLAHLLNTEL
ncbi:MAG TPA: S1/P1 nuclease [Bacteriovoracaceae bacterium]|nr:S1/P1 nuclease [Bacteriovoracaceae bacterium]